jgi:hypothetical protein
VARSLRAAGRRLVAAPRQGLIEADFDARALRGSAPYLGTLIRRHRGFFGPCAAQPHRCGRRDGVFRADDRRTAWPFGARRDRAAHISQIHAAGHSRSGFSANRGRARRRIPAEMVRTAQPREDGNSSTIHSPSCLTLPRCTVRHMGIPLHGQDWGCLNDQHGGNYR